MARARRPAGNPSRESHNRLHVEYNLERPPIHGEVPADEGWQSWFRGGGVSSITRVVGLLALGGVVVLGIISVSYLVQPLVELGNGRTFDVPENAGINITAPEEELSPPVTEVAQPTENMSPEQPVPESSEPEKSPEQQAAAPESPEPAAETKPAVAAQPAEETPAPENP
jgi:hypothetical protein